MDSRVIWITGLSGAGKTTLAQAVTQRLRCVGNPVLTLDGDELRELFGAVEVKAENHGRQARLALAMQYAHLCRILSVQGLTVVIATISLFKEVHAWNRANLPGYFEVYLNVPMEELRRRDPKQIYLRYDSGEINDVAGLDLPVDEPEMPDIEVIFQPERQLKSIVDELFEKLMRRV